MKKKIHIVNHTHWDREWYFTTMDAILLSDQLFSHAIDELKKHPEAKFCLDGQSSVVTDFLSVNPERETDIKSLVTKGQLMIGPWYSQTDAFAVNEESYFRNLAIGTRDSRRFGPEMKIGYLPDTFGFNAQMPTLLSDFGVDNMIFWRGFNIDKFTKSPYFKWKGLGDKSIYVANMPGGYGAAVWLNSSDEYINERLLKEIERLKERCNLPELLLTAGSDQMEIIPDLQKILNEINQKIEDELEISSYPKFIEFLRQQELPEYQGEMREPVEIGRVHKTIGSVHYDIKRANYLIEQKLLKRVEPLMAIATAQGLETSTDVLWTAWKKLLAGHAHDSLGGSVADTVAIDILHRFKEADELADGLENLLAKRLSEKLNLTDKDILVFNTTSKKFEGYKVIDFLSSSKKVSLSQKGKKLKETLIIKENYFAGKDNILLVTPESKSYVNEAPYYQLFAMTRLEIPSMGYTIVHINEEKSETGLSELAIVQSHEISNEFYSIKFDGNELRLKNRTGQEFGNFLEFEDMANDGDTYDFSPLAGDCPILLKLELKSIEKSEVLEKMHLTGIFNLPFDLEDRLSTEGKKAELVLDLTLTLQKESKIVRAELNVENAILSHRLRVKLNTGVQNSESIASLPLGFIRRQSLTHEIKDWFKEYVEYPIDIEPFDKSVSVTNQDYHVSAFAKGLKEYQFQDSALYLTLFASTGQLGKPNLAYRLGRASGDTTNQGHVMMPTPMAQLQGHLNFEFAFVAAAGEFNELETSEQYLKYTDESLCYQNQKLNLFVHRLDNKIQPWNYSKIEQKDFSLLSVDTAALDSCLMPSLYDKNAFLLRLVNPTNQALPLEGFDFNKFSKFNFVNAAEDAVEKQDFVAAYDTVTIKLQL